MVSVRRCASSRCSRTRSDALRRLESSGNAAHSAALDELANKPAMDDKLARAVRETAKRIRQRVR